MLKIWFFGNFGGHWRLRDCENSVFCDFGSLSKFFKIFDFFGFWRLVWKFSREALGLSWHCSVGCRDSSGLVGFDYDDLHFSVPPPSPLGMSW